MSTTIPITLTPVPVPVGVKASDFNQLVSLVARFLQGSIKADVSFFQTVAADPSSFTYPIIFNSTQGVFKYWDLGAGRYTALTQFQPGDIKNTFSDGDSPQTGWIVCDGRKISDVPNISQTQSGMLIALFGTDGSLPTLSPIQAISGLPTTGAFSGIDVPTTTPPKNQIANLPFSSDYNPAEGQNLAGNTETLRGSQDDLRTSVTELQAVSEKMLTAFSGATSNIVACVFVGYP